MAHPLDAFGSAQGEIREEPGQGLGLFATAAHRAGDVLVSVPQERLLDAGAAAHPAELAVPLRLLAERRLGEASAWAAYIAQLPDPLDVPLCWGADRLAALDAPLRARADEQIAAATALAAELSEDAAELRWALGVYWSRALALPPGADRAPFAQRSSSSALPAALRRRGPAAALMPLIDVLNHAQGSLHRLEWRARDRAVVVVAGSAVRAGEQICISYGAHGNADLLLRYGFALPHNAADTLSVRVGDERFAVAAGADLPPPLLEAARLLFCEALSDDDGAVAAVYPAYAAVDWSSGAALSAAALSMPEPGRVSSLEVERRALDHLEGLFAAPEVVATDGPVRLYQEGLVRVAAEAREAVGVLRGALAPAAAPEGAGAAAE